MINKKIVIAILLSQIIMMNAYSYEHNDSYQVAYNQQEQAEEYYKQGLEYNDKYDYDTAITYYKKAIDLDPKNSYWYSSLGFAYQGLKKYEDAITYHKKAIELDPKNGDKYGNLGWTYHELKRYEDAIPYYKKAIDLEPENGANYFDLGSVYYELKRYEDAITYYKKAIDVEPNHSSHYISLGNAYQGLKKYEEVITYYKKAIELDPKNAIYYDNLGFAYSKLKRYEESITYYKKAIELDPKNALYYGNLGWAYHELKRYEEAVTYYKKAINLDPNDYYNYFGLGNAHYELKNYQEARNNAKKSFDLDPSYDRNLYLLGKLEIDNKNYTKALEYFNKVLKDSKKDDLINSVKEKISYIQKLNNQITTSVVNNNNFSGNKLALVIGNKNYSKIETLTNPENDANALDKKLSGLGFNVSKYLNLKTKKETKEKLVSFTRNIKENDTVFFYYSGHGVQLEDKNYLIPTNANIEIQADIEEETMELDYIIKALTEKAKYLFIVVDACRDNPFKNETRSIIKTKGLSVVRYEPLKEQQVTILFASSPNEKAIDLHPTKKELGLFAGELVDVISIPNRTSDSIFRELTKRVKNLSNSKQIPYLFAPQLTEDFYFNP
jgi:tetratricopeptide (TPR) repeat protein